MESPLPDKFSSEYEEIKELVANAKKAEDEGEYKTAKHYFLDAASISLTIAKQIGSNEEVTFRNIARILVDQAKEMQQLLDLELNPLPSIPGAKAATKPVKKPKQFSKKDDPILLQLMIIQDNGIPIFTWTGKKLSESTQNRINDILFSGAITAVNSLISEVLSKPIQSIQFEDGNIVLKFKDELIFVVFSEGNPDLLEDNIERFSNTVYSKIYPEHKPEVEKGRSMDHVNEVEDLLEECFVR